ncbi:MAG: radical SAM protein [Deltaproteobacteria bacterium]|nr:radical SAM protein [Deltaproteobacteria bacterium]
MRYEGAIFRPPSEADSLILQVTIGCSHNRCKFCGSYKEKKFRVRTIEEIKEDLTEAKRYARFVKKVFLADGDALVVPQKMLLPIFEEIKSTFPKLERIGIYGNVKSILKKSVDDLRKLKELGLGIVYLGIESGDQVTLNRMDKGTTVEKIEEASKRVKDAGITLSVTVLLGIGGEERTRIHAEETGKLLSRIEPDYVGALTLIVIPGTPLADEMRMGKFRLPDTFKLLEELYVMIENINVKKTFFASNHASNYLPLKGWLPDEKERMLSAIRYVLEVKDPSILRPEYLRAL